MVQAENLEEFKKKLGERLELLDMMPWSQQLKDEYKRELFKTIIKTSEYQLLGTEYSESKKRDQENNNEMLLQEAFDLLQIIHPSLKKEDFMKVIHWKQKERMDILELEEENHKIDKNLSINQKIKQGWKKVKLFGDIDWKKEMITMLRKKIDGSKKNAFVREYIEDEDGIMPKHLIGEQIFNRNAVINLGLRKRLLNYEQMKAMRWGKEKHQEFLEKNFQKDGKNVFPGYRNQYNKKLSHVGTSANYRTSEGDHIDIYKNDMYENKKNHGCAFSLRSYKF